MTIKNLLKQNNYQVSVLRIDGGCKATFPAKILGQKYPQREISYRIKSTKPCSISFDDGNNEGTLSDVPDYACRPLVCFDIVKNCLDINYDVELISFEHNSTTGGLSNRFTSVLEPPKTKKAKTLETRLWQLFSAAFSDNFPEEYFEIAEEREILDGYFLLLSLFES